MRTSDGEILFGRQPVHELLAAARRRIDVVYLKRSAKPTADMAQLVHAVETRKIPVEWTDDARLDALTSRGHHQGVAARCSAYPYVEWGGLLEAVLGEPEPPFLLLLDHLQDPQNLGSILRSAEAAGVQGVVLPSDRAVGVTPAAVRASAGASEHLRIGVVNNLPRIMRDLKNENVWIVGLEKTADAVLYSEADLDRSLALVVGSEGEGMGRLVRETCDFIIALPTLGKVGSLNAGAACAVALYEARRQRAVATRQQPKQAGPP